jgi:ABC-type phosphate transport system substrate-binding protein
LFAKQFNIEQLLDKDPTFSGISLADFVCCMVVFVYTGALSAIIKMRTNRVICVLTDVLCFLRDRKKEDDRETSSKGTINISVDESFKPVIEEQLSVHQASFPNTTIHVSYKSEAACLRDLQSDSTRMVIVAKGLNEKEEEQYKDNLGYKPTYGILAYDAVVVIVNRQSKDSVFTIARVKRYPERKK